MTILDAVNQRLNAIQSLVTSTDNKIGVEQDARAAETQLLGNRVAALEQTLGSVTDELIAKQQQIDSLTGRVDLLVQQLTELGVDANI